MHCHNARILHYFPALTKEHSPEFDRMLFENTQALNGVGQIKRKLYKRHSFPNKKILNLLRDQAEQFARFLC